MTHSKDTETYQVQDAIDVLDALKQEAQGYGHSYETSFHSKVHDEMCTAISMLELIKIEQNRCDVVYHRRCCGAYKENLNEAT